MTTDAQTTAARLGFIGFGLMGSPIAMKLLENSHSLMIWGRQPEKLRDALAAGAQKVDSAAELARRCDIVFLCITDTAAVEEVVFGDNGIAAGAGAGKILIDHSSIQPAATREMAQALHHKTGMHWLDAPVSGGARGVANKTLAVMAGGEPAVFERVQPIVMGYAGRFTLMGPSGAGQSTKLINQALVGVNFLLLAEVTKLAQNADIDAARIPAALAGGRADSSLLQEYMPYMANADFSPRGRIDIMLKDLDMVTGLARATNTAMPLTQLAAEIQRLLVIQGLGPVDNAASIKLFDKL